MLPVFGSAPALAFELDRKRIGSRAVTDAVKLAGFNWRDRDDRNFFYLFSCCHGFVFLKLMGLLPSSTPLVVKLLLQQ